MKCCKDKQNSMSFSTKQKGKEVVYQLLLLWWSLPSTVDAAVTN